MCATVVYQWDHFCLNIEEKQHWVINAELHLCPKWIKEQNVVFHRAACIFITHIKKNLPWKIWFFSEMLKWKTKATNIRTIHMVLVKYTVLSKVRAAKNSKNHKFNYDINLNTVSLSLLSECYTWDLDSPWQTRVDMVMASVVHAVFSTCGHSHSYDTPNIDLWQIYPSSSLSTCQRHFATSQWGSGTCSSPPCVPSTPQSQGVSHSAEAELRGMEAAGARWAWRGSSHPETSDYFAKTKLC